MSRCHESRASTTSLRGSASARAGYRLLAVLAIAGMIATVAITRASDSAWAKNYPSWSDVLNARNNEAAKQAEIAQVSALIKQNQDAVTSTQAIAVQKGADFQKAQQAYDEASFKADQLQKRADAARAKADESKKRAGQMAARLSRVGGGNDVSATLFFDSAKASDLLSTLGMASKITDQSQGVYARATQDRNASQSLTDQANVAKEALKALASTAEQAMTDAQTAADSAAAALQEQQDKSTTLQAQLTALTSATALTEAQYEAGVQAAQAAAAALRRQQAEAAARAAGMGGGGSGVSVSVSASGWTNPVASRGITSNYGPRIAPCSGCSSFHEGVDLAAGCGAYIFAAHAGSVAYAGVYGGYGNYVRIDNGDGVATAYGHIMNGGTLVRTGEQVAAGQAIGHIGSTGESTGCHLHFEVRINGAAINPVPFMSQRGVSLG